MKVEVLYFEGCPNYRPTVDLLKTVLREQGLPAQISTIQVQDEVEAEKLKFFGSPTVRINGLDIEADSRGFTESGFACRRYTDGLPSAEMIRVALREATES
jgi:hypothetical protein